MSSPWLYDGPPALADGQDHVAMDGTTFCVSDARGDIGGGRASGLFVRDTRLLRHWRLAVDGRDAQPLRVHQEAPYRLCFVLLVPEDGTAGATDLLVTRERLVGDGLREEIVVRNASGRPTTVRVDLAVDADFADVFEVKDGRADRSEPAHAEPGGGALRLSTERDGATYAVVVRAGPTATADARGLHWTAELRGHGTWRATVQVGAELRGELVSPHHPDGTAVEETVPARRHSAFRSRAPRLTTADPALTTALGRSIEDLATLRIFDPDRPELPVVAAGAPWFMALFGRDSLITAMMLLPVDTGLAHGTVTTLARHLGTHDDPVTEEQAGRVPHELRFGPAGTLALGGRNAYFGSADATPLFVMAVGALHRWQPELVGPDLVAAADRALEWMTSQGDPDGDGFIEYHRMTERGLANQGWKDSWDGISFADGTMPEPPIALAEVQAYAFAAYLARADLAEAAGESVVAAGWRARAARLRAAFDDAFWLPDRGWYAVGLDRDKRPIDSLTSNVGHCLWTGIAEDDRASSIAEHLGSPQMSTGWGVRTLASDMGAYNPMSYHNGSVWPHDTAICVSGLLRYGHVEVAHELALGLLDASAAFGGRLPELYSGFTRADLGRVVPYPAACSPQAWAAAAPVEVLSSLLGLVPQPEGLSCEPRLPDRMLPLRLHDVVCRGERYDLEVDRGGWVIGPSQQR